MRLIRSLDYEHSLFLLKPIHKRHGLSLCMLMTHKNLWEPNFQFIIQYCQHEYFFQQKTKDILQFTLKSYNVLLLRQLIEDQVILTSWTNLQLLLMVNLKLGRNLYVNLLQIQWYASLLFLSNLIAFKYLKELLLSFQLYLIQYFGQSIILLLLLFFLYIIFLFYIAIFLE